MWLEFGSNGPQAPAWESGDALSGIPKVAGVSNVWFMGPLEPRKILLTVMRDAYNYIKIIWRGDLEPRSRKAKAVNNLLYSHVNNESYIGLVCACLKQKQKFNIPDEKLSQSFMAGMVSED